MREKKEKDDEKCRLQGGPGHRESKRRKTAKQDSESPEASNSPKGRGNTRKKRAERGAKKATKKSRQPTISKDERDKVHSSFNNLENAVMADLPQNLGSSQRELQIVPDGRCSFTNADQMQPSLETGDVGGMSGLGFPGGNQGSHNVQPAAPFPVGMAQHNMGAETAFGMTSFPGMPLTMNFPTYSTFAPSANQSWSNLDQQRAVWPGQGHWLGFPPQGYPDDSNAQEGAHREHFGQQYQGYDV